MSPGEVLDPPLAVLLQDWLPRQRWYPAKAETAGLAPVGGCRLEDPDGEVGLQIGLVALTRRHRVDVIQVPFTARGAPLPGAEQALIGTTTHSSLGPRWIYDGVQDPVFVREWLRLVAEELTVDGVSGRRHDAPGSPALDPAASAQVLRGEQSNTSVIVGAGSPNPVIVKLFRVLHDGANPDVEVTAALAAAGTRSVPRVAGWIDGEWEAADGSRCRGQLAVATEFLPGSEDAWRVALAAATSARSFAREADGLGRVTAQVHAAMRSTFATTPADAAARERIVTALQERVDWALERAPALVRYRDRLLAHRGSLSSLVDPRSPLPALQRIHGDLHLGQVLHAPERGWVLLDFEGEPLRPIAERTRPDLAMRDVAGMLRSFDYAAAAACHDAPQRREAATTWAREARTAYLDAYLDAADVHASDTTTAALLTAYWIDKALYEVVYETDNRPDWLPVPLAAVEAALNGQGPMPDG